MRFFVLILLAALAHGAVDAYQALTAKDCETVGQLVDQSKPELLSKVDLIRQLYVPSATDEDVRAIKIFIQKLDGKAICERALACGADLACIVRRLLQGVGDTLLSVPELKVASNMYCNMCQSSMPALRRSYLQGHIRALVKHVTRSSCAKFYSWKHCMEVNKWFDAQYEELVRLLTASTTCNDLKFCRTDASMPL